MPKSFLSDDPFAAALDDRRRRPASPLPLLVIPVLGFAVMAVGMHAHPGVGASPLAVSVEKPSRCEARAKQITAIETARRNVIYWKRESCCGAATPRDRAKMRAWERNYRGRLELFARMYPERRCPK